MNAFQEPPNHADDRIDRDAARAARTGRSFFEGPIDIRSVALTILCFLAIFYTLYLGRDLLLPLVLAVLLSFVLSPLIRQLKRLHVPQFLGAALTLVLLLGAVGYGIYQLSGPAAEWADQLSHRLSEIAWKLRPITDSVQEVQKATKEVEEKISGMTKGGDETSVDSSRPTTQTVKIEEASLGETLLAEAQEFVQGTATMVIFLFLLLASGDLLLRRVVRALPRLQDKKMAVDIVRQIENDISKYLGTITLINLGLGFVVGSSMAVLGLPNPVLWGVMAALLNFIPYIGGLFGITAVALVALLTFDHVSAVWLPAAIYLTANVVEAYIFTPMILGRWLTLNPVMIFLSLIVWGWIWGIGGALMAVPILAVVKIVCDNLKPLAFLGELIGD